MINTISIFPKWLFKYSLGDILTVPQQCLLWYRPNFCGNLWDGCAVLDLPRESLLGIPLLLQPNVQLTMGLLWALSSPEDHNHNAVSEWCSTGRTTLEWSPDGAPWGKACEAMTSISSRSSWVKSSSSPKGSSLRWARSSFSRLGRLEGGQFIL